MPAGKLWQVSGTIIFWTLWLSFYKVSTNDVKTDVSWNISNYTIIGF